MQPYLVENTGSTARDFCMLERNILSHLKLALLLSLLSSSLLLRARLIPQDELSHRKEDIPLASVEYAAAMASVVAGTWEYYQGYWDLRKMRAFLAATRVHLIIVGAVAGVVFGTCIVLLVQDD